VDINESATKGWGRDGNAIINAPARGTLSQHLELILEFHIQDIVENQSSSTDIQFSHEYTCSPISSLVVAVEAQSIISTLVMSLEALSRNEGSQ